MSFTLTQESADDELHYRCRECKELKPKDAFRFRKTAWLKKRLMFPKRETICIQCSLEALKARNAEYTKDPRYRLHKILKSAYGLTLEEYEAMVAKQEGRCAICGYIPDPNHESHAHRRLCVDHDHTTGKIRGLLCWPCNTGIGQLKDDPILLEKAMRYLEEYRENSNRILLETDEPFSLE